MADVFNICVCFTLLFLTTIQAVGFLSPNWVTDSAGCQIRGLFYQCCRTNGTGNDNIAGNALQCNFENLQISLGSTVFALELSGFLVLLMSFVSSLIPCCSRDGKDASSCINCSTLIFYGVGTLLTFSGCMMLVSLGHTSFGYSFWLSLFPGSLCLLILLLLICTVCCNACCGDDNGSGARHSLTTICKFKINWKDDEKMPIQKLTYLSLTKLIPYSHPKKGNNFYLTGFSSSRFTPIQTKLKFRHFDIVRILHAS